MSIKSIIVVSPFSFNNDHITFEAACILLFLNLQYESIIFFWENEHVKNLKNIIWANQKISYFTLRSYFWKFLFGYLVLIFVFLYSLFHRKTKIIFLSFEHPHLIIPISLFFTKTIAILHRINGKTPFRELIKKIGYDIFLKRNSVLVLGEWIYEKLPAHNNLSWIYHPLFPRVGNNFFEKNQNWICLFVDEEYLPWAQKIKQIILWFPSFKLYENINFISPNREYILTQEEYFSVLQKSRFCIFLQDVNKYNEFCSGRFFDALSFWVMSISLKSSMTSFMLKNYWEICYHYDSFDELLLALPWYLCFNQSKLASLESHLWKVAQNIFEHDCLKLKGILQNNLN